MGECRRVLKASELKPVALRELPTGLRRRKPRSYLEWASLKEWGRLPDWEDAPPGYLLRRLRERAGLTQAELARRLRRSQQAVAQAERWEANPSAAFMDSWAGALGYRLELGFRKE